MRFRQCAHKNNARLCNLTLAIMYRSKAITINGNTKEDAYYNSVKEFARDDIILRTEEGPLSIIFFI